MQKCSSRTLCGLCEGVKGLNPTEPCEASAKPQVFRHGVLLLLMMPSLDAIKREGVCVCVLKLAV